MFARSAHAAETKLPPIETRCQLNLETSSLISIDQSSRASLLYTEVESLEERRQLNQIQKRIAAKEWEQAWRELQRASDWTQEQAIRPLLVAMFQANQGQRASQLLTQQFPANSYIRAKGVGMIAAELTQRDQFSSAIELLKTLKNKNTYPTVVALPVVKVLASTNQVGKILEVVALFPDPEMRRIVWSNIARSILFQPDQAKQVAALIENPEWRQEAVVRMSNYWFSEPNGFLNGWAISNDIEDCEKRASHLLRVVRLGTQNLQDLNQLEGVPGTNLSETQELQALDQLEAFLNAIAKTSNRQSPQNAMVDTRLKLAELSIQNGRNVQGKRLLQQLMTTLEQDRRLSSGWTLLQIAKQYQQLGDRSRAVQILDSAVLVADAEYKSSLQLPLWTPQSAVQLRDDTLGEIARTYRSLNQPQKATAIEKTLSTRSRPTIPAPLRLQHRRARPSLEKLN